METLPFKYWFLHDHSWWIWQVDILIVGILNKTIKHNTAIEDVEMDPTTEDLALFQLALWQAGNLSQIFQKIGAL